MKNLAGTGDNETARKELEEAGLEVFDMGFASTTGNECKLSVMGHLGPWTFKRAWYYWCASGPGISLEHAEPFNEKWGTEVRVGGHAGGSDPRDHYKGFAVTDYHIDSQEGLNAFAELLKEIMEKSSRFEKGRRFAYVDFNPKTESIEINIRPVISGQSGTIAINHLGPGGGGGGGGYGSGTYGGFGGGGMIGATGTNSSGGGGGSTGAEGTGIVPQFNL